MRRNRLRELLKADQPSLGTHIHSSWPTIIELVGHSGMFDYVSAPMSEKDSAVQNLESLLSGKGADMVQCGPGDYSMGRGLTGQFDPPHVREAEKYVIEPALKMGIAPRAEISLPEECARYF